MATLDILYFAWIREAIGRDGDTIDHPGVNATVSEVIEQLRARGDGYATAFANSARVRAALDQAFVSLDARIEAAMELALFPPVTGG